MVLVAGVASFMEQLRERVVLSVETAKAKKLVSGEIYSGSESREGGVWSEELMDLTCSSSRWTAQPPAWRQQGRRVVAGMKMAEAWQCLVRGRVPHGRPLLSAPQRPRGRGQGAVVP